jgi:hypothetical protein
MVNHEIAIAIMISFSMVGLIFQAHQALAISCPGIDCPIVARAPVAVSGNNIYTAWNNASTSLHGDAIFFTKSNDGGKTFSNAMVLSPPNTNPKVSVTRNNVNIDAAGSTVAVTWWTNETGALNPVIRTSTDGGNTFGNLIRLNSTSAVGTHGSSIPTTKPAGCSFLDPRC